MNKVRDVLNMLFEFSCIMIFLGTYVCQWPKEVAFLAITVLEVGWSCNLYKPSFRQGAGADGHFMILWSSRVSLAFSRGVG